MVEREMLIVNKRRPESPGQPCEQGLMRNRESAHERVVKNLPLNSAKNHQYKAAHPPGAGMFSAFQPGYGFIFSKHCKKRFQTLEHPLESRA
jgi:hypothetical protein